MFLMNYGKTKKRSNFHLISFVPGAGLEPARPRSHWILSPACLPIPPPGQDDDFFKRRTSKKKAQDWASSFFCGANDEIRTRDPDLGKVVLYQLSYIRILLRSLADRKYILIRFFGASDTRV